MTKGTCNIIGADTDADAEMHSGEDVYDDADAEGVDDFDAEGEIGVLI